LGFIFLVLKLGNGKIYPFGIWTIETKGGSLLQFVDNTEASEMEDFAVTLL
jgi:hypothetical protein